MKKAILDKYNQLAKEKLLSITELENRCKILYEETVQETEASAVFRRVYACCYQDVQDVAHPFYFYRLDRAVLDSDGDVIDIVSFDYELL